MSAKALLSASVSAAPVYVEDVFSTFLYTGNNSTQTITNGIDLSGKGGLVWLKDRVHGGGASHNLYDTVRGALKFINTDLNGGESSISAGNGLTNFTSNGFSLGTNWNNENRNGDASVSWTFRKAAKFFDVVTYTGDGNASKTISHNLGSTPGFLIVKRTDSTGQWQCYHRSLTSTSYYIQLNQASAQQTLGSQVWDVSSTNFTVYGAATDTNINNATYVAYLFAHDAGGFGTAGTDNVVSCGSFTYNSSITNSINLGWEPQWVLTKSSSGTFQWYLQDSMRGLTADSTGNRLFPNSSTAEDASGFMGATATGFTVAPGIFTNGSTHIYIAIRRGPMKTPTVGTSVFSAVARAGTSAVDSITGLGFPPDSALIKNRLGNAPSVDWSFNFFDKLRNPGYRLSTAFTNAEDTTVDFITSFDQAGITFPSFGYTATNGGYNYINYFFRRAPGFFDVVAYTGNGFSTHDVSHNLGVAPEMIITKRRNAASATGWFTSSKYYYDTDLWDRNGRLNDGTIGFSGGGVYGPDANITATQFRIATSNADINASGSTYIAYLFATCPGVSKCGSYTGNGTTQTINCDFTSGARFVLIKRTDAAGGWYAWDTARGIISGNDPFLLLNSTAAEDTSTDYIDPLSSGFEISSTAPAAINANGGSYIYLSIA